MQANRNVKPVYLIDFDDSFTYNLACELVALGLDVECLHYSALGNYHFSKNSASALVWGPGPGSWQEYWPSVSCVIKKSFQMEIFQLGVCLGHQLLAKHFGMKTSSSAHPLHGQNVELFLNSDWSRFFGRKEGRVLVQRYNSLVIKKNDFVSHDKNGKELKALWDHRGELMAFRGQHFYALQFHPESVGTIYPRQYFFPLLQNCL